MLETDKGRFMEELTLHYAAFGKQGFVDKILTRAYWRELEGFDFEDFRTALRRVSVGAAEPVNAMAIAAQCRVAQKGRAITTHANDLARSRPKQIEETSSAGLSPEMRETVEGLRTGKIGVGDIASNIARRPQGNDCGVDPRFKNPATVREAILDANRRYLGIRPRTTESRAEQ